jgi:hypothetical protein
MSVKWVDLIWVRFVGFFIRLRKIFTSNTIPENPESTKARINSELELDKYRREAAVITEKISRRI